MLAIYTPSIKKKSIKSFWLDPCLCYHCHFFNELKLNIWEIGSDLVIQRRRSHILSKPLQNNNSGQYWEITWSQKFLYMFYMINSTNYADRFYYHLHLVDEETSLVAGTRGGGAQVRGFSIRLGRCCYDHAVIPAAPLCPASISPSSLRFANNPHETYRNTCLPPRASYWTWTGPVLKRPHLCKGESPLVEGRSWLHTLELNRGKQIHSE